MIFKVIILLGLVQLLYRIEKPFVCSGIYAGVTLVFAFMFGFNLVLIAIATLISFVLSSLYFWLLNYFKHGIAHWVILIIGLPIGWFA